MEPYYYTKMSKPQQAVYYAIYQGLMALSDSFQVPKLEGRELSDVFFQLRLDHPEIFWAEGFHYRYYQDSANITFLPEYIFEKGKIKEHQKALKARVEKLVRPAMKLSEWEKEKYVHDFICENVHYDKLKKSYSHEIIGPLGQGVGVCEGIAKSVKVLCDALGIWCMIAICGNNPEKGIKYRHTWNIVKIGGTYYHLDATFDNTLGKHSFGAKEIRYDYFNLDDKNIFRDHEPLIAPAPACTDGDHFYYKVKKIDIGTNERLAKRIGKFQVTFTCEGYMYLIEGAETRNLSDTLYNAFEECKPVYEIAGDGVCTLTVNGTEVTANIGGKLVIDTGLKLCYTALKETANRRLTGYYEDLYLKEGENTFSVSPGFTVKIKPNWRCR